MAIGLNAQIGQLRYIIVNAQFKNWLVHAVKIQ